MRLDFIDGVEYVKNAFIPEQPFIQCLVEEHCSLLKCKPQNISGVSGMLLTFQRNL